MDFKRVVVTGVGAVTPIGNNVEAFWKGLIRGISGAGPITKFNPEKFKTRIACEVKDFDVHQYIDRKEARRMDLFTQYALVACDEAVEDAKLNLDQIDKTRVGVIWGSGIGGLNTFQEEVMGHARGDGTPRFSPFFIPKMILDLAPGHISMRYGFMGMNYSTVSACASSTNALIDAFNYLRLGRANIIVAGGSEAAITEAAIGGFSSMKALSVNNDNPKTASRPFDKTRDGFILGEGAGALILEEYEHAVARGATIYAEMIGGGMSADAYHLTAPHPEGAGVILVMHDALRDARIDSSVVDYINVHGTSTPLGDVAELQAIKHVFQDQAYRMNISSTKSMTGHLLGAAGAVEAIASVLSIKHQIIPPTINHTVVDENIDPKLNLTLGEPQERKVDYALSNTFGFGGHNSSVIFKKIEM